VIAAAAGWRAAAAAIGAVAGARVRARPRPPDQGEVQVRVGVPGVPEAMNPKVVEPSAGRLPFHETLRTLTDVEPDEISVPFQTWLIEEPAGRAQETVHPLGVPLPAWTFTSPW
jgi:hypothetical protein